MEEVKGHSETSITGNATSKWIYNSETMTAPMLSADFVRGMLGVDWGKGIAVKSKDTDSSPWKNAKIYRNGIHTTVKWGDGTITRVKLTEGEEGNDIDAFLNALGKKLYGSRTALKRFVEQNTVIQKKKEKKTEEEKEPGTLDSRDQPINVGDAVFLNGKIFKGIPEKGEICKVNKVEGYYVWVDGFDGGDRKTFASGVTKVKVEPPYSAGDYVVFRNPEEERLVHSRYWVPGYMVEDVPERIQEIKPFSDAKELNLRCNGFFYDPLWVRGLDT